jgi:hypothetical protein
MGFNLSISWFFVLAAFLIMCWLAYRAGPMTPPSPYPRWYYIGMALFFLSILVTGVINMHTAGGR